MAQDGKDPDSILPEEGMGNPPETAQNSWTEEPRLPQSHIQLGRVWHGSATTVTHQVVSTEVSWGQSEAHGYVHAKEPDNWSKWSALSLGWYHHHWRAKTEDGSGRPGSPGYKGKLELLTGLSNRSILPQGFTAGVGQRSSTPSFHQSSSACHCLTRQVSG